MLANIAKQLAPNPKISNAENPKLQAQLFEQWSFCGTEDAKNISPSTPFFSAANQCGAKATYTGSREYVLHCVDAGSGFVPVGQDSVHLADSTQKPSWQFAVVAQAVDNLQTVQPTTGLTRSARSILPWNLKPVNADGQLDCNYKPIWGNVLEYKIRLNQ
ncbi:MAG: hypothetical protein U5L74_02230 [Ideonella sp.]|nr:hypothetical protein [Ideonella sp.]